MKIATVSYMLSGGAGKAAFRLNCGLVKNYNAQTEFIQYQDFDKSLLELCNIVKVDKRLPSTFDKLLLKFGIDTMVTPSHEKLLKSKPEDYEIATFPTSDWRIEAIDEIKSADIVNLHWVSNFINYPSFFKKVDQPIVWTLHDMNPFMGLYHYEGDDERNKDLFSSENNKAIELKRSSIQNKNIHVVCLSEWMMEKSKKSTILGGFPHYLIPNGIDLSKFAIEEKPTAKEKVGVNNGLKTILFIAEDISNYRKGFDILKTALTNLSGEKLNVITVGENVIELPKNFNHFRYDYVTDEKELNLLYAAADLFVLPSREDNLPNVMLESFAMGTPVVSFSNGGMKDWVKHGKTGILINQIDAISLANEIKKFNDGVYTFDSIEIRQFAEDNFAIELQTERYMDLYKKLLN